MLDHIIGIDEASRLWGVSTNVIEDLCVQQLIVSKKIDGNWVVYKDQNPSQATTKEVAEEFSKEIEWNLLSSQERRAILDENTRIFYEKVEMLRFLRNRPKQVEESLLRKFFDEESDEDYEEIKEAADELDSKSE